MKVRLLSMVLLVSISFAASSDPVSGYNFLDETTRAMQDDDFENPGMITVDRGLELFHELREVEEYSCSSCHGQDGSKLDAQQIARYPVFDKNLGGLVTLQSRINQWR